MQTGVSKKVVQRFFEVLKDLPKTGRINYVNDFYVKHGIDARNMYKLQANHERDMLKLEWLTIMVENYDVSATYLLTGKGERYVK